MSVNVNLHSLVKDGFTDGAKYDQHRPEYAEECVTCIARMLSTNFETTKEEESYSDRACDILELGAGTGMLTKRLSTLLPKEKRLIASEPMPDFFNTLQRNCPTVNAKQHSAESIPLPDNSVEGIVAAQSFHWFANEKALSEMLRVLKPKGNIVLVWNIQDRQTDWVRIIRDTYLQKEFIPDEISYDSFKWKDVLNNCNAIGLQESKILDYPSIQYSVDGLIELYSTMSVISQKSPDDKQRVLADLRHVLSTHPDTVGKDILYLPHYIDLQHYIKR
ncbi:uncharacterized methyltransferase-like C25B8.10 [Mizuhopecten yessoensis]|uniref:Methyltransferase-like C25B8.10 n=1 Tax=Mizuhopecten yessoensis TaxID=6573 RepID=A0A210Q5X0_MIZYE|nr:uncharacterized methyltransferase-like C25B8.10 [Mizuhopecten yessoensis]OWF44079.1 methyltransferase-like C25B8.10 [Mizuhopecten yessoensis]